MNFADHKITYGFPFSDKAKQITYQIRSYQNINQKKYLTNGWCEVNIGS